MKIGVNSVDFLGVKIHKNKIQLQEHILKKIADFKEQELLTKKGLRSWLGILNYARAYIPNLGKMLGPLYEKTSPTGEIRFNSQDWKLVREIKQKIHQLPPLELPPKDCCIVLEADGCMDGWGAICKWKPTAYDPRTKERITAYASGKFQPVKPTIDAEIFAIMNAMEAFKIYYLDKKELIIRTDCQAIVSFFNKSASNKPSRARWVAFTDYLTGTGMENARKELNHPARITRRERAIMERAARDAALERANNQARPRRNRGPRPMARYIDYTAYRTPAQRFCQWSSREMALEGEWINGLFDHTNHDLGPLAQGYYHNNQIHQRLLQDGIPGDVRDQLEANNLALLTEAAMEARRSVLTLHAILEERVEFNRRFVRRDNAYEDRHGPYMEAQAQVEAACIFLLSCIEDL
nr:polyprotein [Ipomoea batatas]